MIVIDDENIKLEYDDSLKATILVYKKPWDTQIFKDSRIKMVELFIQKGIYKHITKIENMKFMSKEELAWIDNTIIPQMIKNAPKNEIYIALVFGDDAYSLFLAQTMIQNKIEGRSLKYFNEMEKAKAWISNII